MLHLDLTSLNADQFFSQSKQLFSDILFILHKEHVTVSVTENMICV